MWGGSARLRFPRELSGGVLGFFTTRLSRLSSPSQSSTGKEFATEFQQAKVLKKLLKNIEKLLKNTEIMP